MKKSVPLDPTEGLCLGTFAGPRGKGVSYERGTPVTLRSEVPVEPRHPQGGARGGGGEERRVGEGGMLGGFTYEPT